MDYNCSKCNQWIERIYYCGEDKICGNCAVKIMKEFGNILGIECNSWETFGFEVSFSEAEKVIKMLSPQENRSLSEFL